MTVAGDLDALDRLLILELYAEHAQAMDAGDTEAFVGVFAPDAVAYGVRGHAAIRDFHRRFLPDAAFPGSQHFASHIQAVEGDASRATVHAYVTRMYRVPGATNATPIWHGYYIDTVVKRDGRWVFQVKHAHLAEELLEGLLDQETLRNQNAPARELFDMGLARNMLPPRSQ